MASRKLIAGCAVVALAAGGAYVLAPGNPAAQTFTPSTPATMARYERPTPTAAPVFHAYWEHARSGAVAERAAAPVPELPAAPQAPSTLDASESRATRWPVAHAPPVAGDPAGVADVGAPAAAWPHLDAESQAQSVLDASRRPAFRTGQPLPQAAHAQLVPGVEQARAQLLSRGTH